MSKLLEHIIRQMLFEQVNGNVQTTVGSNKQNAIEAGAIQSFKFVSNPDSTQPKFNDSEAQNSINAGRFYQKNMIISIDNFFKQNNYPGYNNVLNDQHVVIMGNMPIDTNSFTILFWVFTLDEFYKFSKFKDEEKQKLVDDAIENGDVKQLKEIGVSANAQKILQTLCLSYDEYLNRYTTTNTVLEEINQGVQQDVITLHAIEKNREKIEFIESSEFPKEISMFTCFAILQNDDTIQQVINIDTRVQDEMYTYITYQYDEWIKWSKNIQGISDEMGILENSYKVRQACNIEKTNWSSVKILNDLIKRQYSETEYNNLLFDDAKWQTKFITTPNQKVEEQNTIVKVHFEGLIKRIINEWNDTNNVARLIWDVAFTSFGSYQEYLKQLYINLPDNLKYLILKTGNKYSWNDVFSGYSGYDSDAQVPKFPTRKVTTTGNYKAPDQNRKSYGPNSYKWEKLAPITWNRPYVPTVSYKTEAADIIREAGIEYLNIILQSLPGISFYESSCNLNTGQLSYTSDDDQNRITNRVNQQLALSVSEYKEEYFDFVVDKLTQVRLDPTQAPEPPEYEVQDVEEK